MNILGLILGFYASRMRDGLAYFITMARYPFYKPGKMQRRDIEWSITYHRVRHFLGAT